MYTWKKAEVNQRFRSSLPSNHKGLRHWKKTINQTINNPKKRKKEKKEKKKANKDCKLVKLPAQEPIVPVKSLFFDKSKVSIRGKEPKEEGTAPVNPTPPNFLEDG